MVRRDREKWESPYIFLLVGNVDAEYQRLVKKGVRFKSEPKNQSRGGSVASFTDPDGNIVCLLQGREN